LIPLTAPLLRLHGGFAATASGFRHTFRTRRLLLAQLRAPLAAITTAIAVEPRLILTIWTVAVVTATEAIEVAVVAIPVVTEPPIVAPAAAFETVVTALAAIPAILALTIEPAVTAVEPLLTVFALAMVRAAFVALLFAPILVEALSADLRLAALAETGLVGHFGRLVLTHLASFAFGPHARLAALLLPIALLRHLLAVGHDDAVVVLGVLKIVLGEHRVAGHLRIARERHVLFGDMRRRATDFDVGAVRLERPGERILVLTVVVVTALLMASTSAAILLSLPHVLSAPVQ
jgi:hypothetical protein